MIAERDDFSGLADFKDILTKRLRASEDDVRLSGDYIHPHSTPISNWADRFRRLHGGSALGSYYETRKTPYMYGVYQMLYDTSGDAESVIICKAAQIGVTEALINYVGFAIDKIGCSIIYCMGTDSKARTFGDNLFAPMFRDHPLHGILQSHLEKGTRRAAWKVRYPNGHFELVGGQSPNVWRSTAAGICIIDEYSAMPISLKNEGSAHDLAKTRTKTYGSRGKVVCCSTPTIDSTEKGSLMKLVDEGDKCHFFMPCPHCKKMDYFSHEHFAWRRAADGSYTAWMVCQGCMKKIYEHQKMDMMMKGEWRATQERKESDRRSLMISGFLNVAPNAWAALARKWQSIIDDDADPTAFFNHDIGIPYTPSTAEPDANDLKHHCILPYTAGVVPAEVKFLTMSLDPHKRNIRWEIKGHADNLITYSIATGAINIGIDDAGAHEAVRGLMECRMPTKDGYTLPIIMGAIDSGYHTDTVYDLASYYYQPLIRLGKGRIIHTGTMVATKGSNQSFPTQVIEGSRQIQIPLRKTGQSAMRVWRVGTQIPKRQLYLKLAENEDIAQTRTAHGSHYYPEDYPAAIFRELIAEKWTRKYDPRTGRLKDDFWRPRNVHNEALDLHVLNIFCGLFVRSSNISDPNCDQLYEQYRLPLDPKKNPPPVKKTLKQVRQERAAARRTKK